MNRAFVSAVLLAAVTAAGCAAGPHHMYEGDPRPMEELAVIHAGGALCRVMQVDGTSVGFGNPQGLYLLPGKHKVLLVYSQPGSAYTFGRRWTKELEVGFVAGHTYLPRFQFADDGGMRLGIEDRGTRYPAACLTFDVYKKQYEQLVVEKVEGCP